VAANACPTEFALSPQRQIFDAQGVASCLALFLKKTAEELQD
jgi:hypothetical protein